MKLSIVTTLYRSQSFIDSFLTRATAAAGQISNDYEIVIVDDGSPDNSLQLACAWAKHDPHVRVVELSRNFGHHRALMAGMIHAVGDLVFLIDSDLEEDPAWLVDFHAQLQTTDADVVYGVQSERKGGWAERVFGGVAFRIFDLLIPYKIPRNHITVRLMRRDYVDALVLHKEQATVIGGLWVITGFRQIALQVSKSSREGTNYSIWRRWRMLVDSIVSFSELPLIAIFYLGIFVSCVSAMVGIWLIIQRMAFNALLDGWASVMLSVWLLGGVLIFCVGLIGIYVSKIFVETKNRPYVIVRRVHHARDDAAPHDSIEPGAR
ncbi:MAG: glycosyltransferase family 2 protein [Devosia sp.]